jgi:hypothetical protein
VAFLESCHCRDWHIRGSVSDQGYQAKKTLSNRSSINLRQIGLALYEYENEFGEYPNEHIAALITKKSPKPPTSATQNKESRTSSRLSFFQSDHHG